jgi:transposase
LEDSIEGHLLHTRWCLLKRPENLTEKQEVKLAELLHYNLKAVRTYLLKEDFQFFWDYRSPTWAGKFLDRWCTRALRSRLEPMKKVARMLQASAAAAELVSGQKENFQRGRRGSQQPLETDPQKSLWLPDFRGS